MYFDSIKLKYHMAKKGYTIENLAKALDMNAATLSRKINGRSDFYRSEINEVKELLNLTDDEVIGIFFNEKLA